MINEKGGPPLNDNRGWIKLHRKLVNSELWPGNTGKKFSETEAWLDLLFRASYEDNICYGIAVKRGQVLTSQCKLAKKWGWSRGTTKRYIETLIKRAQISTTTSNRNTLITICNYETYQGASSSPEVKVVQQTVQQTVQQSDQQTEHNQEVKNIKKYIASSRKRETPNTDHGRAVAYWHEKYRKRFGMPYLFKNARDGKSIKNLLANFGFEDYCLMVDEFLNGDDKWVAKHDKYDLAMLESKANELSQRLSGNGSTSLMTAPNGGYSDLVPH